MIRSCILWLTLGLTACASLRPADNGLDGYIAHPVSDAVAKLGRPPTNRIDLGPGRAEFDWVNYGPCTYSVIATTSKPGSPSLADWKIESSQQTDACAVVK
jgi:hypothetical protein